MWLELRYAPTVKDDMGYLSIPPIGGRPQSGRMWFERPYDISSGAGARCGLSFDTLPYWGAGPRRYGLSFDTPPQRGPGPRQTGCGLSFETPNDRGPGSSEGRYVSSFYTCLRTAQRLTATLRRP